MEIPFEIVLYNLARWPLAPCEAGVPLGERLINIILSFLLIMLLLLLLSLSLYFGFKITHVNYVKMAKC